MFVGRLHLLNLQSNVHHVLLKRILTKKKKKQLFEILLEGP